MIDQRAVLCVDDKESTRCLPSHWLWRANFQAGEAATGEDALETVVDGTNDLAALELNLPNMNGSGVFADGLVEGRGDPVTDDLSEATALVHDAPAEVEDISDRLPQGLHASASAFHDLAIMARAPVAVRGSLNAANNSPVYMQVNYDHAFWASRWI